MNNEGRKPKALGSDGTTAFKRKRARGESIESAEQCQQSSFDSVSNSVANAGRTWQDTSGSGTPISMVVRMLQQQQQQQHGQGNFQHNHSLQQTTQTSIATQPDNQNILSQMLQAVAAGNTASPPAARQARPTNTLEEQMRSLQQIIASQNRTDQQLQLQQNVQDLIRNAVPRAPSTSTDYLSTSRNQAYPQQHQATTDGSASAAISALLAQLQPQNTSVVAPAMQAQVPAMQAQVPASIPPQLQQQSSSPAEPSWQQRLLSAGSQDQNKPNSELLESLLSKLRAPRTDPGPFAGAAAPVNPTTTSVPRDQSNDLVQQLLRDLLSRAPVAAASLPPQPPPSAQQDSPSVSIGHLLSQLRSRPTVTTAPTAPTEAPATTVPSSGSGNSSVNALIAQKLLQSLRQPSATVPQPPPPPTVDNNALLQAMLAQITSAAAPPQLPPVQPLVTTPTKPAAQLKVIAMESDTDVDQLSQYQILIRRQLQYFVSQQEDADYSVQGRKKRARLGQVGIRCKHCSHLPHRLRGRGAGYYPAKLSGVYQAAQNMATNHLNKFCGSIPKEIREQLHMLRGGRHDSAAGGGKQFWADSCREIGLVEEDDGLRFRTGYPR